MILFCLGHILFLLQLILKVYGCLSLDERTKVLTSLYGGSQPSPFDVDSDDFARQLLNAQSKLMTSDALQIKDREVNHSDFSVYL